MRLLATVAVTVALLASVATGAPKPDRPATVTTKRIDKARARTFACQQQLGLKQSPVSSRAIYGKRYARWVLTLWQARADAYCAMARELAYPAVAIRAVFGAHAGEALTVARCESGQSMTPRAHNGQYLGMFQMGSSERRIYGHGDTPLEQARAAHRYFVASGRDWSPWQCSPYGGLQW